MPANIISTDKVLYQGGFLSIILPASAGEISVLPHHAPLITPLKSGKIKIKNEKQKEIIFDIERGILEVKPNEVNILITLK